MRTIEHAVDIQAPAAAVWHILTDTDKYEDWNPFMPRLSGRLVRGERLTLTVRPGKRTMTFRPTVLAFQDGTLIRWRGRLGMPGLFDGEHELRLEPIPDGGTRFVQRETFTGLLVPMMPRVLDDTATGFAAMNTALRDRAASRTADEEGRVAP
ncbi:SRPBCC family protein [Blastococcus sp. SYSU DS0510]